MTKSRNSLDDEQFIVNNAVQELGNNGYHGKIMLEAHGATVTVSLDEETRLLNISAYFPQKEGFNPYPE
ncbi:hypothetical protein ACW5W8_10870 [Aeromonas aquatilis]